jgi:16S rRNA (cytidine1402-2'-O)-methyltransferase
MADVGRLVLVGTPIGNLGDLSPRAVEVLSAADLICCEDTRRTRALLAAAGIPAPPLVALHAHNEAAGAARAVAAVGEGRTVVAVSDAGMPGISDPGERLVAAAIEAGVEVTVVPGPTAAVTALVLSGLPAERWCFEGFLPRKGPDRKARLAAVAADERTTVLYESPHRVAATVADLLERCSADRPVALARELTKLHEEIWRGTLEAALTRAEEGESRGEWVIVLSGHRPDRPEPTDHEIETELRSRLAAGEPRKEAVTGAATAMGIPRRRAYDLAVKLKHE